MCLACRTGALHEGLGPCTEGWSLYGEVEYIMGNGHMGPPDPQQNDRQTPVKILPSRNFVGGR